MGNILNPVGSNSFVDLVAFKDEDIFVDKTDFIAKMSAHINKNNRLFAVMRPRRFGKTVTAHMLLAYYSKAYAGRNIFDNLKITDEEHKASFEKHLNKYDVIYIDMNSINARYKSYLKKSKKIHGVESLVDYLEYSIIRDLRGEKIFAECFENNDIENIGLLEALTALRDNLNERFVFIMVTTHNYRKILLIC